MDHATVWGLLERRVPQLTATEGLQNVTYELADAEVHPFPTEHFDVVISRFGTMFFRDPVRAFTNLAMPRGEERGW